MPRGQATMLSRHIIAVSRGSPPSLNQRPRSTTLTVTGMTSLFHCPRPVHEKKTEDSQGVLPGVYGLQPVCPSPPNSVVGRGKVHDIRSLRPTRLAVTREASD